MTDNKKSTNEIHEAALTLASNRLLPYAVLMNDSYDINWHHREIADVLERVENGEIKKLIISMPPRRGKSELVSVLFPSWFLGKNPNKKVMQICFGDDLAVKFGRQVRNIVDGDMYRELFPESKLADDNKSASDFTIGEKGEYAARGIRGMLTGLGAHLMIIDDPIKNREDADSESSRQYLKDFWNSVARTRLEPNGAVILVMTRWHEDDLAGFLTAEENDWHVLSYPEIAEEDEVYRKAGEVLWPSRFSLDDSLKIKSSMPSREWNALYQQRPGGEGVKVFYREWYRYWNELPDNMGVIIIVDPAFKKNATNDWSVVMAIGKKDDKWYVLEYFKGRYSPSELIEQIVNLSKKWKPIKVGVEAYAAQTVIGTFLKHKFNEENIYLDVVEVTQVGSKENKIKGLEPLIRNGLILWSPVMIDLEQQLEKFPVGKHDDIIDAMQMGILFDWGADIGNNSEDIMSDQIFSSGITLGSGINSRNILTYNKYGEPEYG